MADTKDFYYKLFAREYLTSGEVRSLPLEAQGILPRLWCVCCLEGSMPEDLEELSCAAGVKLSHLRTHMHSLLGFFCAGAPGRLVSRRMERERAARIKASDGASKAAKAKHAKDSKLQHSAFAPADAPAFAPAETPAVNSSKLIVNNSTPPKEKESCGEGKKPPSPPPSKVLHEIPCTGQGAKVWILTEAKAQEWAIAFPGVDILTEVLRAKQWLIDNPRHRKTHQGMPAYFGRWFARVQDRGPRPGFQANGKPPCEIREPRPHDPNAGIDFALDDEYPPDEPESAHPSAHSPLVGPSGQVIPLDGKKALSGAVPS